MIYRYCQGIILDTVSSVILSLVIHLLSLSLKAVAVLWFSVRLEQTAGVEIPFHMRGSEVKTYYLLGYRFLSLRVSIAVAVG